MILRDFLLSGIAIATILWCAVVPIMCPKHAHMLDRFISNRVLLSPPSHSTPADSFVEWAYVFDVHTNAFFPLYLTLYLAQLLLLPIVLKDNWVCLWLGNTLYLAAWVPPCLCCCASVLIDVASFAQYTYGIYLGFSGKQISARLLFCTDKTQHCPSLYGLSCYCLRCCRCLLHTFCRYWGSM